MAAANMGRPCPPDPLWYRLDCTLHVRCRACGHARAEKVESFAMRHRLDSRLRFYELERRLKCDRCKRKDAAISVTTPGG